MEPFSYDLPDIPHKREFDELNNAATIYLLKLRNLLDELDFSDTEELAQAHLLIDKIAEFKALHASVVEK